MLTVELYLYTWESPILIVSISSFIQDMFSNPDIQRYNFNLTTRKVLPREMKGEGKGGGGYKTQQRITSLNQERRWELSTHSIYTRIEKGVGGGLNRTPLIFLKVLATKHEKGILHNITDSYQ